MVNQGRALLTSRGCGKEILFLPCFLLVMEALNSLISHATRIILLQPVAIRQAKFWRSLLCWWCCVVSLSYEKWPWTLAIFCQKCLDMLLDSRLIWPRAQSSPFSVLRMIWESLNRRWTVQLRTSLAHILVFRLQSESPPKPSCTLWLIKWQIVSWLESLSYDKSWSPNYG